MNIQAEKLDLIQWVLQLTDSAVLSQLKELKSGQSSVQKSKARFKIASLRGKASPMANETIDTQLKALRDEWTRDI
jgi:hypothetical protein